MPTYQYACTACDHRFEAVQSFSDASLTTCPACSGMLRKVFSSVGIVFKGSGFYRTDSRAGAGSTVANGEGQERLGQGRFRQGRRRQQGRGQQGGGRHDRLVERLLGLLEVGQGQRLEQQLLLVQERRGRRVVNSA